MPKPFDLQILKGIISKPLKKTSSATNTIKSATKKPVIADWLLYF
jgi:hypothetical protein